MNKIEELEERCAELEDRVEALEKAIVAALARPGGKPPVVWEQIWLNGIPQHRGAEWPDPEMFKVHFGGVTWYGGQ